MKKLFCVIASILVCLSLCACGEKQESSNSEKPTDSSASTPTDTPQADPFYVACTGTKAEVVENAQYVKTGYISSICVERESNSTESVIALKLKTEEVEWRTQSTMTFDVYNPLESDVNFSLFCHMDSSVTYFQDPQTVENYVAKAGTWSTFTVTGIKVNTTSSNGTYPFLGVCVKEAENEGIFDAVKLYFCGFDIFAVEE